MIGSKVYHRQTHTHVMVKDFDKFPARLILAFADSVWVAGDHSMNWHDDALVIDDKAGNSFDEDGNAVFCVPKANCTFLTEAEAAHIAECLAIDAEMRANAR